MGERKTQQDAKSHVALGYQHAGKKPDSQLVKESDHDLSHDIVAFETAKRELIEAYHSFNRGVSLYISELNKPTPNLTVIQDAQRIINDSRKLIETKNTVYQSTKAKIITDLEQMGIDGKDTKHLKSKLDPDDTEVLRKKANKMECARLTIEIEKHVILRNLTPSRGPATAA